MTPQERIELNGVSTEIETITGIPLLTLRQWAEKSDVEYSQARHYARKGLLRGATRLAGGMVWLVPFDCEVPRRWKRRRG